MGRRRREAEVVVVKAEREAAEAVVVKAEREEAEAGPRGWGAGGPPGWGKVDL